MATEGFEIWWSNKGDRNFFDFWSYSEKPSEFSLPSAYDQASRTRYYNENEGKMLLPSHRVGVEPERPAITIYRVQKDGTDTLGSVIGPGELQGQTWESVAQMVGDRILWDSREGIELMIALQPDRRAEDNKD